MKELIGKYAYKKLGSYAYLIGRIEVNDVGLSPYKLVTKMGTPIGFRDERDIVLVAIEDVD